MKSDERQKASQIIFIFITPLLVFM